MITEERIVVVSGNVLSSAEVEFHIPCNRIHRHHVSCDAGHIFTSVSV